MIVLNNPHQTSIDIPTRISARIINIIWLLGKQITRLSHSGINSCGKCIGCIFSGLLVVTLEILNFWKTFMLSVRYRLALQCLIET